MDDATHTIIKSHQIEGWDNFPLADWITRHARLPAVLGNDADVAGLAEALFGAGKGLSPIFYITIGSGIGGGLIIDGEIYRGCGRGRRRSGTLRVFDREVVGRPGHNPYSKQGCVPLEQVASAGRSAKRFVACRNTDWVPSLKCTGSFLDSVEQITHSRLHKLRLGMKGEPRGSLDCTNMLSCGSDLSGLALLCPRRDRHRRRRVAHGRKLLFEPLREFVAERVFQPFADCYDIVPAALGEEVVVHGALALARRRLERVAP